MRTRSPIMRRNSKRKTRRHLAEKSEKIIQNFVNEVTADGWCALGRNLYLQVGEKGAHKSYGFRWSDRVTGKDRRIGLGSAYTLTLEEAREEVRVCNKMLLHKLDPMVERRRATRRERTARGLEKTVNQWVDEYLEKKI